MLRRTRSCCIWLATLSLAVGLLPSGSAWAQGCGYFSETFGSPPAHDWVAANGTWNYAGGRINVTKITPGRWAYAEAAFSASDHFNLDVDFQLTSPSGDDAVAI